MASHLSLKIPEKQELLETPSVVERLEKVYAFMEGEIGVLQVEKRIRGRVKRQMEKTQREYYLNEQMKAIQKELGESEDGRDELPSWKKIAKHQALQGSAGEGHRGAEEAAQDEPDVRGSDGGAQLSRLDAGIPWKKRSKVKKDIRLAQKVSTPTTTAWRRSRSASSNILPCSSGMNKIKGPILCLVGPPGVGKTSLGKSMAGPRAATSCACRWAVCATRPKSAAIGGPISARCPARSSRA